MAPVAISLCIVMVGIISYVTEISFLELIEAKTIDLRFRSRGQISPSSKVVIAAIDEKSLDREGKWVWPRSKIADLVTKLSEAGVRVIVLDIVFSEPDKLQAYNDAILADAIAKSRSKVVLGFFFHMTSEGLEHIEKKELDRRKQDIEGGRYRLLNLASGDAQSLNAIEAAIPESNIAEISRSTNYTGFFNVWQDSDGVVRAVPTVVKYDSAFYAPLTLVTMSAYWGDPLSIASYKGSVQSVSIGTLSIPTNPLGKMLINFRGEHKTIPHISVTDILNKVIPNRALKNKIVIVGATAIGLCDIRVTPFSTNFPAPEIHANIVDNILSKDFIREPPWSAAWDIMAMIVLGLLLAFLLPRFGFILSAVTSLAIFVGYILLCQYLFSSMGLVLNLVYPLTVAVLVYLGITTYGRYSLKRGNVKNAGQNS
ncbi:MAG: CHASE2 domain-containing protein [Deltaproteobacteria bacterium]|nr:CHASE2 domain-containing protein [Deltaproteobacteria bacterium]